MIIPMRGGFGLAPINQGSVYFSRNISANHAALNVIWNFGKSVLNYKLGKTKKSFMSVEKSAAIYEELYSEDCEEQVGVLNTSRPNILILIIESFSSNLVEAFGGEEGITPELNAISKEGIRFENIYAAGTRSDKGLVAIMAGCSYTGSLSLMHDPRKSENVSSMINLIKNRAYSSKFYYGGDLDFANMRSFLYNMGFDDYISEDDFRRSDRTSKWGVPDHILFDTILNDLGRLKQPFINMAFSISSHEPFDVPYQSEYTGSTLPDKFRNSVAYTDHWLGWFIDEAKQQDWWNSTLIFVVADHGSRLPGRLDDHEEKRFRIPMLWTGGAIRVRDTTITRMGGQTDIAATLLGQLQLDHSELRFSKNLLCSSQDFAFYNFTNGFGFIMPGAYIVWDKEAKTLLEKSGDYKLALKYGKALYQESQVSYMTGRN